MSADIPPPAVPFILQVLMNNKMADGLQVNKDETELYFRIWKRNEVCIGPVVKGIKTVRLILTADSYMDRICIPE